jgi:transcriptional regulator with XRE-family HTH domain
MSSAPLRGIRTESQPVFAPDCWVAGRNESAHLPRVLSERVAGEIKRLRKERGWSKEQLAVRCVPKTVQQQIDKLETGERRLTLDWVERIARAFGMEPLDLMMPREPIQLELSEQVANEIARSLAQVALSGQEPEPGIVEVMSLMLQELTQTFSKHPQAYRDPAVARPVVDMTARRFAPVAS